jgi:D-alanyl-D-alanine carboxypeptidase
MKKNVLCLALLMFSLSANAQEVTKVIVNEAGITLDIPYFELETAEGTKAYQVKLYSPPNSEEPTFLVDWPSLQIVSDATIGSETYFQAQNATKRLKAAIEAEVNNNSNMENAALLVAIADKSFIFSQAAGIANSETGQLMTPNHPFRIASVSKTVTAAVVLLMIEAGIFNLDDSLGKLLTDSEIPGDFTVNDILIIDGVGRGSDITVRQLLSHRSGLKDYLFDPIPGKDESFFILAVLDIFGAGNGFAKKQWNAPDEFLEFYLSNWSSAGVAVPGKVFHYADTNYALLGKLIEKYDGSSLAQVYRKRIFNPLGMHDTYLEWFEDRHGYFDLAHHFLDFSAFGLGNLNIVSKGINTSSDWAGGGLVSTLSDLHKFMDALFHNRLFSRQDTFNAMTEILSKKDDDSGYGLGLEYNKIDGLEVWGHNGFWGVEMLYVPEKNAILVVTTNQVEQEPRVLLKKAFSILIEANW